VTRRTRKLIRFAMPADQINLAPRSFTRVDAKRAVISLLLLGATFGLWYLVLPVVQRLIIPGAPGGTTGPWIIRPGWPLLFGSCVVAAAVSVPLLGRRLRQQWTAQDLAAGTKYVPFGNPAVKAAHNLALYIKGIILLLIYASALLFYLFSWGVVGPSGIEQKVPWGARVHAFDQIVSLQMIPKGEHNDELNADGPWYSAAFSDGSAFTFDASDGGVSDSELTAIAKFVADRSGKNWHMR